MRVVCTVFVVAVALTGVSFTVGLGEDQELQLGPLFSNVKVSQFGVLTCTDALAAGESVSYVQGCLDAAGAGKGWQSPTGICRQCPEPGSTDAICIQDGMEFLEGSTVRHSCAFGYSMAGGSSVRTCTASGWSPIAVPRCVSNTDPEEACPSPWGPWSECDAVACGEVGMRFRQRGQFHVYPSDRMRFFAQCDMQSGMGECSAECPATTPVPATVHMPTTAQANTPPPVTSEEEQPTFIVDKTPSEEPQAQAVDGPTGEIIIEAATTVPVTAATTETDAPEQVTTEAATVPPAADTVAPEVPMTNVIPTIATAVETETEAPTAMDTVPGPIQRIPDVADPTPSSAALTPQNPVDISTESTNAATTPEPVETSSGPPAGDILKPGPAGVIGCEYEGSMYPVGTILSLTCPPGWRRHNGKGSRRCKEDGQFHGKQPSCIHIESRQTCPPPLEQFWSACTKECSDIKGPPGEQTITTPVITVNRVSDISITSSCELVTQTRACAGQYECLKPCPPFEVDNGDVTVVSTGNASLGIKGFALGALIEVKCHRFYEPTSHPFLLCRYGEWSDDRPACQVAPKHTCEKFRRPAYGECYPVKSEYVIGEHVTCTCQMFFGNTGSAIRLCKEGNMWSGRTPYCQLGKVMCGDPGRPENAIIRTSNGFGVNSSVVYDCKPGFTLIGHSVLTCRPNGMWNHPQPECRYNFQPVDALVNALHTVPNLPCQGNGMCQCMAQSHCPACTHTTNMHQMQLQRHEPCCGMCASCCLELVFAIDESGSITNEQFHAAVNFSNTVVESYRKAHRDSCLRVGAVKFGHRAQVVANLTNVRDFRWPDAHMTPQGGGTGIRCALKEVHTLLRGSRPQCRKVVFLVTDGRSNHCGNPRRTAQAMKCDCIELYAVGIGSRLKLAELDRIASDPSSSHLFILQEFDSLYQFGAAFQNGIVQM